MAKIECSESYRSVGLHPGQSPERLAQVRREIDQVFELEEVGALMSWIEDVSKSPEARVLAGAMVEAIFQLAVDERRERPAIDVERVQAITAPLSSTIWIDPNFHCAIFESDGWDGRMPVRRERPIKGD